MKKLYFYLLVAFLSFGCARNEVKDCNLINFFYGCCYGGDNDEEEQDRIQKEKAEKEKREREREAKEKEKAERKAKAAKEQEQKKKIIITIMRIISMMRMIGLTK